MKRIGKKNPYYYPLTPKTTRGLFKKVFEPIEVGQSSTFRVAYRFGGAMTLIRFFISEFDLLARETGVKLSSDTCRIIVVDPVELVDGTKQAYMDMLYHKLCEATGRKKKNGGMSYTALLKLINEEIAEITRKFTLIFVFRGIGYLEFSYSYFWGNIKNMKRATDHWERVNFLFVVYEESQYQIDNARFSMIRDHLFQNVTEYNSITDKDIDFLIKRWGKVIGRDFTKKEIDAVKKISGGYPYLIKYACLALQSNQKLKKPLAFLKKNSMVKDIRSLIKGGRKFEFDLETGNMTVNGVSVRYAFSPREYDVLVLLADNRGEIVGKDRIAEVIWPGEGADSYSDWAITQLIKRLRKKLVDVGVSRDAIKTVHGRGYMMV